MLVMRTGCLIGWSALGAVRDGDRRDGKQRRPLRFASCDEGALVKEGEGVGGGARVTKTLVRRG
jgi:hypothetical protein